MPFTRALALLAAAAGSTFAFFPTHPVFTGAIENMAGVPLPGAAIVLGREIDPAAFTFRLDTVFADSAGGFRLAPDPVSGDTGVWFLEARAAGYHPMSLYKSDAYQRTDTLIAIGKKQMGDSLLPYGYKLLKATVLRPDGITPAAMVRFSVDLRYCADFDFPCGSQPDLLVTQTDEAGRVDLMIGPHSFSDLVVALRADALGSLTVSKPIQSGITYDGLHQLDNNDTLVLMGPGRVTGSVRDAAGVPVPNYPVTLSKYLRGPGNGDRTAIFGKVADTHTDGHGAFEVVPPGGVSGGCRIEVPRPDSVEIPCPGPGSEIHQDVNLTAGSLSPNPSQTPDVADATNPPGPTMISGNVITITGAPMTDALVILGYYMENGDLAFDSTSTDAGGTFRLTCHAFLHGSHILFMETRKRHYHAFRMDYDRFFWLMSPKVTSLDIGANVMPTDPIPPGYRIFKAKPSFGDSAVPEGFAVVRFGCLAVDTTTYVYPPRYPMSTAIEAKGDANLAIRFPPGGDPHCRLQYLTADAGSFGAVDTLGDMDQYALGVTLKMLPRGVLSGKAVDGSGRPAANHVLNLRTGSGTALATGRTDADGNYSLVPTFTYYDTAACQLKDTLGHQFSLPCPLPGQRIPLDINLATSKILLAHSGAGNAFRIRRENGPAAEVRLQLEIPYDACRLRVLTIDGSILFQDTFDHGSRTVTLGARGAGRLLLVQWSSKQGRGFFKVPAS